MSVRSKGATKAAIGILGFAIISAIVYFIRIKGYMPTSLAMIPLAVPGAYSLMGVLEIITGVPFLEIAQKWDNLAGWQRGILGLLIVLVAIFVMITAMVLLGTLLWGAA